ncbi:CoA-binding protein, partial [Planctomycetota bacterium]
MLDALFEPKSITVMGASRTPGKVGHEILANLIGGGYPGRIIPVNPEANHILGLPCYPTIAAAKDAIDLSVIALPAAQTLEAVQAVVDAGTRIVAVLGAGFAEAGTEGIALQEKIRTICATAEVRLLGPNCLGVINTNAKLNASFSQRMPKAGPISVLSQSGALCTAMVDWAASRDLGLAKVISTGNNVDLDATEIME